jgi:hypothetical protein
LLRSREESGRRLYRSRSQLILGVALLLLFDAFAVGLIFEYHRARTFIFGVLFIVANTLLFLRLAAAAIVASENGIYVRNVFSSFDLKWEGIQRFDIGRWKLLPYVCLIHLRDGSVKHAMGISESTNFPNKSAERMTDELNEELANRRPSGSELQPTVKSTEESPGAAQRELFRPPRP